MTNHKKSLSGPEALESKGSLKPGRGGGQVLSVRTPIGKKIFEEQLRGWKKWLCTCPSLKKGLFLNQFFFSLGWLVGIFSFVPKFLIRVLSLFFKGRESCLICRNNETCQISVKNLFSRKNWNKIFCHLQVFNQLCLLKKNPAFCLLYDLLYSITC